MATAALIFLHGLGDTGHGWDSILKKVVPKYFKVICPTAPTRPVTLNAGMMMPSWFDIRDLNPNAEQDKDGIMRACQDLEKLITSEIASGIKANRIVIGGFSQGGAVALYTTLTTLTTDLSGCVVLSSWLPLHKEFVANPQILRCRKNLPVFFGHGTSDPLIPLAVGLKSHEMIKQKMGLDHAEFRQYSGLGHSSCDEEMKDLRVFLEKNVPESH